MTFDALTQPFRLYYNQLPENTGPSICKSALYSFTISLLAVNKFADFKSFRQPLLSAGIAAAAALVNALVTPLFNFIFGNNEVGCLQEGFKLMVNALAVHQILYLTSTVGKIKFVSQHFFKSPYPVLLSSQLVKFGVCLSVPVLNWTIGWWDPARPQVIKQWFVERGVDFTTRSNAIFIGI